MADLIIPTAAGTVRLERPGALPEDVATLIVRAAMNAPFAQAAKGKRVSAEHAYAEGAARRCLQAWDRGGAAWEASRGRMQSDAARLARLAPPEMAPQVALVLDHLLVAAEGAAEAAEAVGSVLGHAVPHQAEACAVCEAIADRHYDLVLRRLGLARRTLVNLYDALVSSGAVRPVSPGQGVRPPAPRPPERDPLLF